MIRLVTDSTCDIPPDLAARHSIVVVPAVVTIDDQAYLDGVTLSRAEFYQRLPVLRQLPTTAAPAAGEFENAYRACGPAEIISIHLASQLSGMFNAARLGAEAFGRRVHLVDSGQVSMGLGWQVLAAAEAIAASLPLEAVLAAVESARRRVRLYAVLDTIEFLRRGGRANAFAAVLGELLQIKPLLEVSEGRLVPLGRLRTRSKMAEKMIELTEALGPLERLAVLHTRREADARAIAERLAPCLAAGSGQDSEPLVIEATTVIGTHTGPHGLGIAAVAAN